MTDAASETALDTGPEPEFLGILESLPYQELLATDPVTAAETLSEVKTAEFRFRQSINAGVLLAATAMNGANRNAQGTGAIFDLLSAACVPGEYVRLYELISDPAIRVELGDLADLNARLLGAYSSGRPTRLPAG